jgi:hypothetical protein
MPYKFEYATESIKQFLSNQNTFWDVELEHELLPVLQRLRDFGEPEAGANVGFTPGITELVYELQGKTFKLIYTVSAELQIVKFYECYAMSHSIDWQTALDAMSDSSEEYYIPQIGDHRKFLKAIDLISQSEINPCSLGSAMGSRAKKVKDISRRGYYYSSFLEALGLLEILKIDSKAPCTYKLTAKGELIAKAPNTDTKERLFAEALLGFFPLQLLIDATARDQKELTSELIGGVIRQTSKDGCGGTTNPRRAGSLRSLINWVSRMAGIPIYHQLYIPNIYAD